MERISSKPNKSLGKKLCNRLKGFDIYGKAVMLTYEGEETFKTFFGGLISFAIFCILTIYFCMQLRTLITRNDTSVSKSTLYKDLIDDTEVHQIGENGFMFGMSLIYDDSELLNDPSYVTYAINQVIQLEATDENGDISKEREKISIPTDKCGVNSFSEELQVNIERLSIDEYLCPTDTNLTVAANYFAPRFDYIEIKFYRCNPLSSSVTCQDSADIESAMKESKVNIVFESTYFDFGDFEEPVHHFIEEQFFWDLAPGFRKKTDIYIRKNEATLIDDYVQLGQGEELEFYQIVDSREQLELETTDMEFLSVYLRFDSKYDLYERRVYSFGDLLGQLGGIYESMLMIGAMFVGIFAERLFIASIIRKIYQIDQNREDDIMKESNKEAKKSKKKSQIQSMSSSNREEATTTVKITSRCARIKRQDAIRENIENNFKNKSTPDIEWAEPSTAIDKIKQVIFKRIEFIYDYKDIFQYVFCCVKCRKMKNIKKAPKYRKHVYYKVGSNKLQEELDCVTVIRAIRQLKLISKVLFNKKQMFLLKYQKQNVINSSGSSSDGEGDAPNIVTQMKNNEEKLRDNLSYCLDYYDHTSATPIDKRLVKGIIDMRFSSDENNSQYSGIEDDVYETQHNEFRRLSIQAHMPRNFNLNNLANTNLKAKDNLPSISESSSAQTSKEKENVSYGRDQLSMSISPESTLRDAIAHPRPSDNVYVNEWADNSPKEKPARQDWDEVLDESVEL